MVESDIDADLFGGSDNESEGEAIDPPEYIDEENFQKFCKAENICLSRDYGYTQLKTFKPYYFDGQVVRGYGIFTLFRKVNAKTIYLRVRGYEKAGEQHAQVLKAFKKTLFETGRSGNNQRSSVHALLDNHSSFSRKNTNLANVYGPALHSSLQKSATGVDLEQVDPRLPTQPPSMDKKISSTGPASDSKGGSQRKQVFASQQFDPPSSSNLANAKGQKPASQVKRQTGGYSNLGTIQTEENKAAGDLRAQSQTFKDQEKFWLPAAQIFKLYENKPQQSMRDGAPSELVFLQGGCKAYTSAKNLAAGQYVIPFSFKLPENIPGTFNMQTETSDGRKHDIRVCYTVEMFLDTDMNADQTLKDCFTREHEFEVREWLFTDEEVEADVKQQQLENKVKTLFKTQTVLKPMFRTGVGMVKDLADKLARSDNQIFYDKLLEHYTERGQPISNAPWETSHTFRQERSFLQKLCCRRGSTTSESVSVQAQLTKPIYFTDETIKLEIKIDNSKGERDIDDIEVTLRQIVHVKTDTKNAYKHGQMNYDSSSTKVYDLSKLGFGNLDQGKNSNDYVAKFNIVDVVQNLFQLRDAIGNKKISVESVSRAISEALVKRGSKNFSGYTDERSEEFKNKFMNVNMKRSFGQRPSAPYKNYVSSSAREEGKSQQGSTHDALGHMFTVNGFTVSSNFVVNLTISIRGDGSLFDKKVHKYSQDFPIYIRSKPLKHERIADVEQLGLLPNSLKSNIKNLWTHFGYIIETPILLPGCATAYDQLQEQREFFSRIL